MKNVSGKALSGWLLLLLMIVAAGWSCSPPPPEKPAPARPVAVAVQELKVRDLPVLVEAVGRLTANRQVTVSAEVGGVVSAYHFDIGDKVEQGQTMVEIDPTDYQLALNDAKAALTAARAQLSALDKSYERVKKLLPKSVIPNDTFEKTEAEFLAAQASASRARIQRDIASERLSKTIITAPFTGFISARMVELGQMLAAGGQVMQLIDLSEIKVLINAAEADFALLDFSDPVEVVVEAFPDRKISGRINRLGVKADPLTNTFPVEILIENQDFFLKDGFTARVRIIARVVKDAIVIPQSAVLYRADGQEVFTVGPDDRAELRKVTLGRIEGSDIQALSGLAAGDRLVTSGGSYLKDGGAVTIISGRPES